MGVRFHFILAAARRLTLYCLALLCAAAAFAQDDLAVTPSPTPVKKLPPLIWDAGVGFTDYGAAVKPGYWYPVWIRMTSGELPIKGTVRLRQIAGQTMRGPQESRLIVDVPVDIPPKTTKIYRTYYQVVAEDEWQFIAPLTLTLRARDIPDESMEIAFRPAPQKPARHVLVLASERGGYGFLRVQGEDGFNPSADAPAAQELIYGLPDFFPEDPILLDSLDILIIDAALSREINEAQWTAIEAWTAGGGALVLGAGRHAAYLDQSALREPFGFKLPPAAAAPIPPDAKSLLDAAKIEAPGEILSTWLPTATAHWERVWIGDDERPLIASKRIGRGRFVFCAAALDPWMISLLEQLDRRDYFIAKLPPGPTGSSSLTPLAGLRNQGGQVTGMQEGFAIDLVGAGWVFFFLLAYNLLAMPLNWSICRRLGKPGLPWLVLMIMALGFAWYGYHSGMERQQQNFQVNTLTFLLRETDSPQARAVSFDTIYSPRRVRMDLPTDSLAFPAPAGEGPAANQAFLMTFGAGATVRDWLIHPWTVSNFRTEFARSATGSIETFETLTLDVEGQILGRLINNTEFTFEKWWLAKGDHLIAQGSGPLEPLSSGTLTVINPDAASLSLNDTLIGMLGGTSLPPGVPADALEAPYSWRDFENALLADIRLDPTNETKRRRLYDFYIQQGRKDDAAALIGHFALLRAQSVVGDRWWFIGLGPGFVSPLTSRFSDESGIKRLLYEQPIEVLETAAQRSELTARSPIWTVSARIQNSQVSQLAAGQTGPLPVPLNHVEVDFVPDAPFQFSANDHVQLTWRLDSHPTPGKTWQSGSAFKIAGCFVRIYNFRTRSWESLGDWIGLARRSGPAADYLHPIGCRLRLGLNTNPELLKLLRNDADPAREGANQPVSAREVFGSQINTTFEMGSQRVDSGGPPTAVALHDISIEIVPPPTTPPLPGSTRR